MESRSDELYHVLCEKGYPEDVVDEMLAILIDREAIIKKKELEHAQATINHVYREGL